MNRLFIAIPLDEDIKQNLKILHDKLLPFGSILNLVNPQQYHLTLKFIGPCDGKLTKSIADGFKQIELPHSTYNYSLKKIGMFPNQNNPRVIWSGVETNDDSLNRVVKIIQKFTKQYGIKEDDKSFVPHITIARVKKGMKLTEKLKGILKNYENYNFGNAKFRNVILYSSKLTPQGPIYNKICEIDL